MGWPDNEEQGLSWLIERIAARLNAGHEMAPFEGVGTNKGIVGTEYAAFAKGLRRDDATWFWYLVYGEDRARERIIMSLSQIVAEHYPKTPRPQGLAQHVLHEFTHPTPCAACKGQGVQDRHKDKACSSCGGLGRKLLSMRYAAYALGISKDMAHRDKHMIKSTMTKCDKWLQDRQNNVEYKINKNYREG